MSAKKINKKAVKSVLFGVLLGSLITVLMMLVASLIIVMGGKLPTDMLPYLTLFFLAVGSFSGGFASARLYKSAGILIGAATGLVILIAVILSGAESFSEGVSFFTLYKALCALVASALGGVVGVNRREKIKI
jgi:putative membrane protein (TIGR04086 family)